MSYIAKRNLQKLFSAFREKSPAVVALSGGVDSSVVAKAAFLSSKKSIAVTVSDPAVSKRELESAVEIARKIGIRHRVIRRELAEGVRRNDASRCYHCKGGIIEILKKVAREEGVEFIADGSNFDDLGDSRAGLRACRESGVYSPLLELGLGKKEVRQLARELGLPNYNKPSEACLSSRVMGREITRRILRRVEEAEEYVRRLTKAEKVRVRDYGETARIEVDRRRIASLVEGSNAQRINKRLNKLGYRYVTVDLGGYRVGGV
jgi:uncharacterized protein